MGKTPFEIRLDLLHMAENLLVQKYHMERDNLLQSWNAQVDQNKGSTAVTSGWTNPQLPSFPDMPSFPTSAEIIKKAKELNEFISDKS